MRAAKLAIAMFMLASAGRARDSVRFYEIDPEVARLARKYSAFLKDCRGRGHIVAGHARMLLERELARGRNQHFDVLAVDAFSSDAVPMRLLTWECAAVYRAHLKRNASWPCT